MRNSHSKAIAIIFVIVIVLIVIGINQCLSDTALFEINYDIKESVVSPNGKFVAYAYICDAGATTDYSPQVTIVPRGEELSSANAGNVFIGNHGEYIHVEWKDAKTLMIYYEASEVNKQERSIWGINIEY